jgi:hypothetical protein
MHEINHKSKVEENKAKSKDNAWIVKFGCWMNVNHVAKTDGMSPLA